MNICLIGTDTIAFAGDVDFSSLKKFGELRLYPCLSADQVIENCADADVLLVNKTDLSARVIAALPRLKYIGLYSTGFNNVDLSACKKRGIVVSNTPDYSTDAVAQHTLALLLAGAGSLLDYTASVRRGDWEKCAAFSYYDYPMVEVSGKTLGIFGFGNIGRKVAKAAVALGMKILVCTRTKKADCPYEYAEKEALFSRSDFLSLHCPQNAETLGLIGEKSLALMKPTAILINTARGPIVDEAALIDALTTGKIATAGLDTYEREPLPKDHPLLTLDNVVASAHAGGNTKDNDINMVNYVYHNIVAFDRGEPLNTPGDIVNGEYLKK